VHDCTKGSTIEALVAHLTRECDASSCDKDRTDSHRKPKRDGQTPRLVSDQPAPSLSSYSSAKYRDRIVDLLYYWGRREEKKDEEEIRVKS